MARFEERFEVKIGLIKLKAKFIKIINIPVFVLIWARLIM